MKYNTKVVYPNRENQDGKKKISFFPHFIAGKEK